MGAPISDGLGQGLRLHCTTIHVYYVLYPLASTHQAGGGAISEPFRVSTLETGRLLTS